MCKRRRIARFYLRDVFVLSSRKGVYSQEKNYVKNKIWYLLWHLRKFYVFQNSWFRSWSGPICEDNLWTDVLLVYSLVQGEARFPQ
jgi:hypothetical protein